jgi:hypothetical protein
MIFSLSTSYASAAPVQYPIAAPIGAYADYKCLNSNVTSSFLTNGTSVGFMVFDNNMSYGTTMPYPYNDTKVGGVYMGLYINETIEVAGYVNLGDGPPQGFVFFPASDAWWNFLKTLLGDPTLNATGSNRINIGSSAVNATFSVPSGTYNYTIWLTIGRYTGVSTKLSILSIENAHPTNKQYLQLELISYAVPSTPTNPEPLPSASSLLPIGLGGAAGFAVLLAAGYLIGSKTGKRPKK